MRDDDLITTDLDHCLPASLTVVSFPGCDVLTSDSGKSEKQFGYAERVAERYMIRDIFFSHDTVSLDHAYDSLLLQVRGHEITDGRNLLYL